MENQIHFFAVDVIWELLYLGCCLRSSGDPPKTSPKPLAVVL